MPHTPPLLDTSKDSINTLLDEDQYKPIKQALQCIKRSAPNIDIYTPILERNLDDLLQNNIQHVPGLLLEKAHACLNDFYTALPIQAPIRVQSPPQEETPDTLMMVQDAKWDALREYVLFLCEHPEEPNAHSDTFIDLIAHQKIPADILCSILDKFKLSTESIIKLACTPQLKAHIYTHLEHLEANIKTVSLLKQCLDKETSIGKFFHEKTNKYNFFKQEPSTLGKIRALITTMEAAIQASRPKITPQDLENVKAALTTFVQTLPEQALKHTDSEPPLSENTTANTDNQETSRAETRTSRFSPLCIVPTLLFLYALYINMQPTNAQESSNHPSI